MACSRREFLKALAILAAAGASVHPLCALAARSTARNCLIVGSDTFASLVDLEARTVQRVEIGFNPHSFVQHPQRPYCFIGIEKWGPSAARVDFDQGTTRVFKSGDGYQFYGHGLYVEEPAAFFITRVDMKTGLGHLVGYHPETLEVVHDFQVAPGGLHDCHRLGDGSVMVASSGIQRKDYAGPQGGKHIASSSLVRVDIAKGKAVDQLSIQDPDQVLGHFAVTRAGQILALSSPSPVSQARHGDLFYSPDGRAPLRRLEWDPESETELRGEMLSVALNADHSRAAITNPGTEKLILVDMKEGKIIKLLHKSLLGIAFDPTREKFLGSNKSLVLLDEALSGETELAVRAANPEKDRAGMSFNGSHSLMAAIT